MGKGRAPWPYKVEAKRQECCDIAEQSAADLREGEQLLAEAEEIEPLKPVLAEIKTAKARRLIANAIAGLERIQRLLVEAKNPNE